MQQTHTEHACLLFLFGVSVVEQRKSWEKVLSSCLSQKQGNPGSASCCPRRGRSCQAGHKAGGGAGALR